VFRSRINESDKDIAKCSNEDCKIVHEICEECDSGVLVKRQSQDNSFSPFMSCHRYPLCKYKKNLNDN